MLFGLRAKAQLVDVVDEIALLVAAQGFVLLQTIQKFEKQQPGGLLSVIQLGGAKFFPKYVFP